MDAACSCKPYLLRLCCFLAGTLRLAGLSDLLLMLERASGVLEGPADGSAASEASLATAAAVEAASLAAACTSSLLSVPCISSCNHDKLLMRPTDVAPCSKETMYQLQAWHPITISVDVGLLIATEK